MFANLFEAETNMSGTRTRKRMLELRLEKSLTELEAVKQGAARLVSARDVINSKLAADVAALQRKVDNTKKQEEAQAKGRTKTQAKPLETIIEEPTAATRAQATNEIKRLEILMQQKEEEAQRQKAIQKTLGEDISSVERTQKDCQAALDEARRQADDNKNKTPRNPSRSQY